MTPEDRNRLIRILGLLGSNQQGERAAAALKAHELVVAAGTDWAELLTPPPSEPRVVVRRVREPDFDYRGAAESRMRQLKSTNELQERQIRTLRTRLANLQDLERKRREAEDENA